MGNKDLKLENVEFEVGAFRNNYRSATFYFDNDERGVTKKQVFINGSEETLFLLNELNTQVYSNDMLLSHHKLDLVLEVGGEKRIVALANKNGNFVIIKDEFFNNGDTYSPNGNLDYFKSVYGVSEEELTSMVNDLVLNRMKNDIITASTLKLMMETK